ncbi:polysaccharide deacetylase family protein [Alicyclobacillus fastidiosus]|uniref:Polysaccharide deacetylase family protein n=1 Tax=Alicyclobacillus fastidiosus TaxID=392011 RepID=A0ABV5ADV1_9BACL|nr:polysaccharide deacetylase family protein [Alicyclobacillus fastidiosus]WEH11464.1 polysaccharide deacetylase family protein [Alicyclobacillus fastidiosus]
MKPRATGPFEFSPITRRPTLSWPNGARVAVWIVPNIEVFALCDRMPEGRGNIPDIYNYSKRDYGARVGVWRIMDVLSKHDIRATVALNSEVCNIYPEIVEEAARMGWEFMGHNETNTQYLYELEPALERALIDRTLQRIEQATGERPQGWLGSGLQETWHTLDFLADARIRYVADWVNDDQPYYMNIEGYPLVSIPYTVDLNDKPMYEKYHRTALEFEAMICRHFDTLYEEGKDSGRVMAIALHPYITGTAHRILALDNALKYISSHEHVWFTTGQKIVEEFVKQTHVSGSNAPEG